MAHGKLQCLGSPLFLKNKFGVGYTLTIVKAQQQQPPHHPAALVPHAPASSPRVVHNTSAEFADPPDTPQSFVEASRRLLALVQSFIPAAEPLSDVGAEQSFRLPFEASGVFVELFSAFDANKAELGISEYGISVTTLEEVFIRVGEMEQSINDLAEGNTAGSGTSSADSVEKEELGAALGAPLRLLPLPHDHGHGHPHVHHATPALPSFPEEVQLEGETSPHSPRPVASNSASSALTASNLDKNSASLTSKAALAPPPIHGILVDHSHHGRQRSASSGSNSHGRSVSHDHAHLPSGAHKRVSFRDSASESGERSSILFDAQAAVMAGAPPSKGKKALHGLLTFS